MDTAQWLPKSKIEYDGEQILERGDNITVKMPRRAKMTNASEAKRMFPPLP
jgi:hypothetical protein